LTTILLLALVLALEPCDVEIEQIPSPQGVEDGRAWFHGELEGPCDTDVVVWSGSAGLQVEAWKGDRSGLTAWATGPAGPHTIFADRGNYQGVLDFWLEAGP
jgi:hypothetical protein